MRSMKKIDPDTPRGLDLMWQSFLLSPEEEAQAIFPHFECRDLLKIHELEERKRAKLGTTGYVEWQLKDVGLA